MRQAALLLTAVFAAGCAASSPIPSSTPSRPATPSLTASPSPGVGEVIGAPGSDSEVYAPNPGAIVVAIDPGHGGCLDWGVPNPWDNIVDKAEKTDTLAIGLALRRLLEDQGVTVVMTRRDDSALAGDDYPPLGCTGPPWRDVDGNGELGFEETGRTRTRDELQARIDLVNLSRADLVVSIHVNSLTQDGVAYEVAATQTFFDDETPWGVDASGALAAQVQRGVVDALEDAATYGRQDRGTQAVAYYMISRQWTDGDTCELPADRWCKPHRGLQLPGVLAEVGSISLELESELLASDRGRLAAAEGIYAGLRRYLGARQRAVRYDALVPGGEAGALQPTSVGTGPPFLASVVPADAPPGELALRLTNSGTATWPATLRVMVGWSVSEAPYLADAPPGLDAWPTLIPPLAPGESVVALLADALPEAGVERQLVWVSLADSSGAWTEIGSPALQLAIPTR